MKLGLAVVVLSLSGCAEGAWGTVHGKLALAPEAAEISFVPEPELRSFLERRDLARAQLALLSDARLEAERELRRVTDESLLCRLELVRNPPPRFELEAQKRRLTERSAAVLSRRRALGEWADAVRREAKLPPPPAARTVSASRAGHFEAALPAGRYGVAVRSLGSDGRWHTSLSWAQVDEGAVGEVQLDETELALEE